MTIPELIRTAAGLCGLSLTMFFLFRLKAWLRKIGK